jgi:hypothetical protein
LHNFLEDIQTNFRGFSSYLSDTFFLMYFIRNSTFQAPLFIL